MQRLAKRRGCQNVVIQPLVCRVDFNVSSGWRQADRLTQSTSSPVYQNQVLLRSTMRCVRYCLNNTRLKDPLKRVAFVGGFHEDSRAQIVQASTNVQLRYKDRHMLYSPSKQQSVNVCLL